MSADTSGTTARTPEGWDRETFVEEMGLLWETAGSGRMDGRIIAYLLITDIPYVSSGALARALRVSPGSISLATRRLTDAGFLKRHAVPGERSHYFRVDDDVWGSFLAGERRFLDREKWLAEQALTLLGPEEEAPRRRLRNMRDYMNYIQGGHHKLLTGWREYQEQHGRHPAPAGSEIPAQAAADGDGTHGFSAQSLSPALAGHLVPDALWAAAEPVLPPSPSEKERQAFTAVAYVLTSGCGWQQLPAHFGVSPATAHRRFTGWTKEDVWRRWHQAVEREHASGRCDARDAAWCALITEAATARASG
ncbi:transposase [Streptomyces sp. NPDC091212]|uniref:transposase n=1 Tax=Streptomyces sp. NPDC091212 TaxID=3155191 RepID=UPI00343FB35D